MMTTSGDLFDWSKESGEGEGEATENESVRPDSRPLAHRMRPVELDELMGQERVLGPGKPLRKWIETDQVPSLILWGPPGCGKTTLARLIARRTHRRFESLSAVLSGVKDIKEVVAAARNRLELHGKRTILFVDEIHRFNKSQQDALLPHVEDGTVTLIGATTENPSFEINSALLSRTRVIRLDRLDREALIQVLERALSDPAQGLNLHLSSEAIGWLADLSEGDARRALTTLENLSLSLGEGTASTEAPLSLAETRDALESALDRQPIPHDKSGEEHYNIVSALIKSMRGSDPHAALYYLARMIEAGEDPIFIARRMVIFASEDIGNADPRALQVAIAAKEAVEFIGMPEGRINLGQAVTYLASAPKSNASYRGIEAALAEVRRSGGLPVPFHLRNAPTKLMKKEGYGKGYEYAHDRPAQKVKHSHLPKEIEDRRFYEPTENGLEKQIRERLERLGKI